MTSPSAPPTDTAASSTYPSSQDGPTYSDQPGQSAQTGRALPRHTRGASMADLVSSPSSATPTPPRTQAAAQAAQGNPPLHTPHTPHAPPSLPRTTRQGLYQAAQASRPRQPRSANQRRARNASAVSNHLESSGLDLLNLDVSQLQVDSDSSDSDFRPTGRNAPTAAKQHSRSMSNPLSLFSPKRKQKGKSARHASGYGNSDSSDGEQPLATADSIVEPQAAAAAGKSVAGGRQAGFSTGPCITCGSMMRWGSDAKVFRCGICLTINDIYPNKSASKSPAAAESDPKVAGPISVQETRDLSYQCLRAYLEHVLLNVVDRPRGPSHPSSGSAHQPPPSTVPNLDGQALGRPMRHVRGPSVGGPQPASRGPQHSRGPSLPLPQPNGPPSSSSRTYHQMPIASSSPCAAPRPLASRTHPSASDRLPDEREPKRIFQSLEDYIVGHILSKHCLDSSFLPSHQHKATQSTDKAAQVAPSAGPHPPTGDRRAPIHTRSSPFPESDLVFPADASTSTSKPARAASGNHQRHKSEAGITGTTATNPTRPISIDWPAVDEWYSAILNAGAAWTDIYEDLVAKGACQPLPRFMLEELENNILTGQKHAQRKLLKALETVLKRPGRRISESGDFRFLIISLANPLLRTSCAGFSGRYQRKRDDAQKPPESRSLPRGASRGTGPVSGQHSVIIKRILGLMSNSSDEWHNRMITCFSQFSEARFVQMKELVGSFLAYRLVRYNEKKDETKKADFSDALVPKVAEGVSVATYHAALSEAAHQAPGSAMATTSGKPPKQAPQKIITHGDDWQIKAAVRVLRLFFIANFSNEFVTRPTLAFPPMSLSASAGATAAAATDGDADADAGTGSRARGRGHFLPTSDFYMTLLDNSDLVADYEAWENKRAKFSFCQYPFLLSVWAKIRILEWEAHRQMRSKARDAFFDSIMTHRTFDQHLVLNVRRDCLVEDSLTSVSEAIGTGSEDIKKGIRIVFTGEEGIDAGGLRKEWFLLLVRELFHPDHGMFTYDDESQYCYFNPATFETSDQFFLVGVVLGLAIYNSTILDVALPPYVFRKLLSEVPATAAGLPTGLPRPALTYSLEDLAEFRPSLARGLQQLLDYDGGDVQSTFSLDFTVAVERYGVQETVPLCAGGETRPVTDANRGEYVRLYVRYVLETAVARQFEPFKRGFFTVCGCNALSLFRAEEIELLVRGSDEALDIASLRVAASYDNWAAGPDALAQEPTLQWFWQAFEEAAAADQRRLLVFITGSDRIPATGPASLSIRILCLGEDTGRYPTARTCFNTLTLYRYASKERLQQQLWMAVNESEGFGLK